MKKTLTIIIGVFVMSVVCVIASSAFLTNESTATTAKIILDIASVFAMLTGLAAVGVVLFGGGYYVIDGWLTKAERLLKRRREEKTAETPSEVKPLADQVKLAMRAMDVAIKEIKDKTAKADAHVQIAARNATLLVRHIRNCREFAAKLDREARVIDQVLDLMLSFSLNTVTPEERVELKRAAGKLLDPDSRDLVLNVKPDDHAYIDGVADHLAARAGALSQSAGEIRLLAVDWVSRLTEYKLQIKQLQIGNFLSRGASALIQLDTNLSVAIKYLTSLTPGTDEKTQATLAATDLTRLPG